MGIVLKSNKPMAKQIALILLCALFGVLGSKAITEYKRAAKAHSATQKHCHHAKDIQDTQAKRPRPFPL
jgi:hypothetical protein